MSVLSAMRRGWALAMVLTALLGVPAGASTFTVTSAADSGAGSLRQAVLDANAQEGEHTIDVTRGIGPISVRSEITLTSRVTLNGNGVTLEGDRTSRLFRITEGIAVFNGFTFTKGAATSGNGGAVEVAGVAASAEFNNCTFFDNDASDSGGAVCVTNGDLTRSTVFRNCTIAGNSATSGGGIALLGGASTLLFSIAVGNNAIPIPGGSSNSRADIWIDGTGTLSGGWNVVGETNAGSSFTSGQGTLTGQTASAIFMRDPLALESVDGVQVLRLANTSPARDMIPQGTPSTLNVDQRGAVRPQMSGIDAGAFEVSPITPVSADLTGAAYIMVGRSASYDVHIYPEDASLDDSTYAGGVEWVPGDATILSVDPYGRVTALREGMTTLMARVYGWNANGGSNVITTPSITVRAGTALPMVTVLFDPKLPDQEMGLDATAELTPNVRTTLNGEEMNLPYTLTVSSNNPGVASADVLGNRTIRIAARAVGTAILSATATVILDTETGESNSTLTEAFTVNVTERGNSDSGGSSGGCQMGSGGLILFSFAPLLYHKGKKRT